MTIDSKKLEAFAGQVLDYWGGLVLASTIYLGDKLGLYRALAAIAPATSIELAKATELNERWVREWLQNQAGAGILEYHNNQFSMTPEAKAALVDENNPMFLAGFFEQVPGVGRVLPKLLDSFKTGIGLPFDAMEESGSLMTERGFGPWYRSQLVQTVIPKFNGVKSKLEQGAKVADIGCGSGTALLVMAKAFPKSQFHGYEISEYALKRAELNRQTAGLSNVHFHHADKNPLPQDHSFDFITCFDCIHDMSQPAQVIRAIFQTLKKDGVLFVADMNARDTFEENIKENPLAKYQYGASVLCCLSASLSEPNGAGLGTLGLSPNTLKAMTEAAGFKHFRIHDFNNILNAYYEIHT